MLELYSLARASKREHYLPPPFASCRGYQFVYPARSGTPILTLRYKAIDWGIEDFELLKMVQKYCTNWWEIHKEYFTLIIKVLDLNFFHPNYHKEPEELFSLSGTDYEKAIPL